MFKILPFTYANDETDRILFNTNYSNIQNAVEHEEFYKDFSPWDCFRYYLWQTERLECLVSLNSLLRCCYPASWFLDSIITLHFFCICIFICSHWSASFLETTYWFRLKKNLEKCGNYCESPLLPISQNFHDPVLLPCISFLTYCNVAWSSTYCSNLNCIYLLQKRLLRLITKAHYLANTAPSFSLL